jgi:site-specific DNA recombinase
MRVLGLARQSSQDKGAGTIETQVELITDGCLELGHELVHIVTERTSGKYGALDAVKRASAGWLTEPAKMAQYDAIMVSVRDRIDRNIEGRIQVIRWAEAHGKLIITADGGVVRTGKVEDWRKEMNEAFSAEDYRRTCGEKRATRARIDKRKGRLGYGDWACPYGIARGADAKPVVVQAEAEVLKRIAGDVLAGLTLTAICTALTAEGVRTRRGGTWSTSAVSRMLTRLAEPYARAADGSPYFYPEILTADTLARVRAKLAERSFKKAPKASTDRHDGTLLLQVAFCREGHPLYSFTTKGNKGRSEYTYYRCHTCKGQMVRMEELDRLAGEFIIGGLGALPYMEPVFIPAAGPGKELQDVVRQMDDVEAQIVAGLPVASAARILAKLQARRDELEALPVTEAHTVLRKTGKSVEQEWEDGDRDRRRKLLTTDLQVKLTVWHEGGKLRVQGECSAMVFDKWLYEGK